jgi:hypothetical protein
MGKWAVAYRPEILLGHGFGLAPAAVGGKGKQFGIQAGESAKPVGSVA